MPRCDNTAVDYDKDLAQIDAIINEYKKELKQLTAQRYRLLSKKQHVDMDIVLEHIIEKGLTANEVLELIDSATIEKE